MSQEKYEKAERKRVMTFQKTILDIDRAYMLALNSLNDKRDFDIGEAIKETDGQTEINGGILENESIPVAKP